MWIIDDGTFNIVCMDLLVSRTKNNEGVKKEIIMIVGHKEHSSKLC